MDKPRVLVTGATGFVGSWTLRYWRKAHPEAELWTTSDLAQPVDIDADHYCQLDLRDSVAVRNYIEECCPKLVIHLGGLIGKASLADHLSVNVLGTENLYVALADLNRVSDLRIIQASSAARYGLVRSDELPVTEEQPLRPVSAYAISKVAQDHLAMSMGHSRNLCIIRACMFNIVGPGQPESLVPMAFIKQMHDIKSGLADHLRVGNTSPRRDFVDVRDVVRAFDALSVKGVAGQIYNVASSRDISIKEMIDTLFEIADLDVPIEVDTERVQPVDVPCVRASIAKIIADTAWHPEISLKSSLQDMLLENID